VPSLGGGPRAIGVPLTRAALNELRQGNFSAGLRLTFVSADGTRVTRAFGLRLKRAPPDRIAVDWLWLSGGALAVAALAALLRRQRSAVSRRRWRLACCLVLGLTAIVCAMGAASTSNSLASFLLAGVLGFATIGLAQDHAWRRYG
jgi:hypothetical protein